MTVNEIIEHFPYLGLFLLLVLGGLGLPFPEDATLFLCGVLIATNVVRALPALLVVYGTLILVDFGLYMVGRKYGRMVVTHPKFHKLLGPEKLARLEEKFRRNGILIILLGRHLLVLRAQIFLAAGVMKMPRWKFMIADGMSSLVTIGLLAGAGYLGANTFKSIEDARPIEYAVSGVAGALLLGFIIYKVIRHRRAKAAAREAPKDAAKDEPR
jgi:membrane protein DedA with SNARE-associated domain